ncbi:glycosyltransferase [Limnobaculum xujianqingii]|uniref:glycosyltransferase n=1 Tax=Limnobaculum xujianqingii TaxID=2738837 RepID=UPI00112DC09C|nr:glycosyltransferase [Limnobaculum xujianqingii]
MTKIYFSIPRFALSGGNLVSLELARHLSSHTIDVYCCSGFSILHVNDVKLVKPTRGILNSLANITAFFLLSLHALFLKNYVATHHLTSVFNFIKKSKYALIQDIEVDFYPNRLKWLGRFFWKNYLTAKNVIVTNQTLADLLQISTPVIGFPYIAEAFKYDRDTNSKFHYDVVAIIRDGEYKNPKKTLEVMRLLYAQGVNVLAINASRQDEKFNFIIRNQSRSEFFSLLMQSKIFICLSKWEGLGLPNLEAYVAGNYVISTAIPSALFLQKLDSDCISIVDYDCDENEISTIIFNQLSNISILGSENSGDLNIRELTLKSEHELWLKYAKDIIKGAIT